jgi:predicted polyphosphate/ATP-dependent NAD kinase
MSFDGSAHDSLHAARHLRQVGVGCIVVLGGDGTCRIVAKACGSVPLLPLSTGTNNVVPRFIEGTVAGIAAAHVARSRTAALKGCCLRHKRLLVCDSAGTQIDQALVEVVLVSTGFVGSRAVWQSDDLRQIFASRAQPTNIGLSSVLGMVRPVSPSYPGGVCATLSTGGRAVLAPIAPGILATVGVGEVIEMRFGVPYPVRDERPAVLALDGEREIVLCDGQRVTVTLDPDGPWIVDAEQALLQAVRVGAFLR